MAREFLVGGWRASAFTFGEFTTLARAIPHSPTQCVPAYEQVYGAGAARRLYDRPGDNRTRPSPWLAILSATQFWSWTGHDRGQIQPVVCRAGFGGFILGADQIFKRGLAVDRAVCMPRSRGVPRRLSCGSSTSRGKQYKGHRDTVGLDDRGTLCEAVALRGPVSQGDRPRRS